MVHAIAMTAAAEPAVVAGNTAAQLSRSAMIRYQIQSFYSIAEVCFIKNVLHFLCYYYLWACFQDYYKTQQGYSSLLSMFWVAKYVCR